MPTPPVVPVETQAPVATAHSRGVTPRVVLLCLAIAALFGYAIPVIDYKFANTFLGATHLPPGAVAVLLVLTLVVNPLLGLVTRRLKFSRNEVLTVYLSCLFSCLVPGIGGNNYWVSFIIGSFYFATRENKWLDQLETLPHWMTPALNANGTYNNALVEAWYTGLHGGQTIPWSLWAVPLLAWGALFFSTFVLQACLCVMLRAQWGDHEALPFPLMRLPLDLTEDIDRDDKYGVLGRFFRNPIMWVGFGIAVLIQVLNGLNIYFPDVPRVPLEVNSGQLFTEAPWNQLGWTVLRVWPIAVGITYLLTSEVSFSLWFFYWFIKFQMVLAYYLGFPPNAMPNQMEVGQKLFIGYQDMGAHLMFVALIFWTGREHFKHIFRRAIGREKAGETEKIEPLSYPVAFWGFVLAFLFMTAWAMAAGVNALLAVVVWFSYLVIAIVITRVVAAGGLLFVHHGWMPLGAWMQLFGGGPGGGALASWLAPSAGIVPASVLESACIQDYRGSLMPSFIQSFKLARDHSIPLRPLLGLIFGVILVGMAISIPTIVRLGYENGGLQMQGWISKWGPQMTGRQAHDMVQGARDVTWTNWVWLGVGALITFLTALGQSRIMGFPLHPLGYMMCVSYPMHTFWLSIFLGWLCKILISRFGGLDTYRKVTPGFLGLALGDVSMMLFWLVIDGWQVRSNHQLMPG